MLVEANLCSLKLNGALALVTVALINLRKHWPQILNQVIGVKCLDTISKSTAECALCIKNALLLTFEKRKNEVKEEKKENFNYAPFVTDTRKLNLSVNSTSTVDFAVAFLSQTTGYCVINSFALIANKTSVLLRFLSFMMIQLMMLMFDHFT